MMSAHSTTANRYSTAVPTSKRGAVCREACGNATVKGGSYETTSYAENPRIPGLDLLALGLHRFRVGAHQLDLRERRAAGLLLDQRVHGMLRGEVDQELLRLRREQ